MLNKNQLISYAMEFSSFLVENTDKINKIILYGSVVKGDFNEDSDIDLFIEILDKKDEKKIKKIEERFYKTNLYQRWKLKGLSNELSLIIGKISDKEWENLKRAMLNTGIMLYGKYKGNVPKTYQYTIFVFENIKPASKRVSVHRKIFGFKVNKKRYHGLLDELKGIRLGKSSIMVSSEYSQKIKDFFKSKKITPKIYDVWRDVRI